MRYFMNRKSKLYSMSAYFNKFGFTFTLERDLDELFLSNLIFSSRDFLIHLHSDFSIGCIKQI